MAKATDLKPGVKTSEFWMTLGLMALSTLAALGVLTPDQAETAQEGASEISALIPQLAAALLKIVGPIQAIFYAQKRAGLKNT